MDRSNAVKGRLRKCERGDSNIAPFALRCGFCASILHCFHDISRYVAEVEDVVLIGRGSGSKKQNVPLREWCPPQGQQRSAVSS